MSREIPEYLETELQTAKDEYKVKTTTYVTLTRFDYEKLIQENQQLKEKLNCDLKWALKYDELYKQNQQLKEQYCERTDCSGRLVSSRKVEKYKQVLDEIREHIKKCSFSIEGITNEYYDIVYAEDIEDILDKVKE